MIFKSAINYIFFIQQIKLIFTHQILSTVKSVFVRQPFDTKNLPNFQRGFSMKSLCYITKNMTNIYRLSTYRVLNIDIFHCISLNLKINLELIILNDTI